MSTFRGEANGIDEAYENLRRMVADSRDAILVLDSKNTIKFANEAAAGLFAGRVGEGRHFGVPLTASHAQELDVPRPDGGISTVEMLVGESSWYGEPVRVVSFREVTERNEAKAKIEHLTQVLRAISNVNKLIVQEKDPERLIQRACDLLIETRGYYGAWIAVGVSTPTAIAHAGHTEEDFQDFRSQLLAGNWPYCRAGALNAGECYSVERPFEICGGCPLAPHYASSYPVVTALRCQEEVSGLLGVSFPETIVLDDEEISLLLETAGDIAFALHAIETERKRRQTEDELRSTSAALRERVKELNCLYSVSGVVSLPGDSFAAALRRAVALIPAGFQYPEHVCARITCQNIEAVSEAFERTKWSLRSQIIVAGEPIGLVEVYYRQALPERDEGPFLEEERSMLDDIARQLGVLVQRWNTGEALLSFERAVESSTDAIGMSNPDGRHYYQNPAFDELFGDVGETPPDTIYVDKKQGHDVFEVLKRGEAWSGEVEMYGRQREKRQIELRAYPLKDQAGDILGLVGVHTDVTERRELKVQLAQSDRLSSMGMLAAGVAHEINNPLAYILYNLQSLNEDLPKLLQDVREIQARLAEYDASSQVLSDAAESMNPEMLDDILDRFKDALSGTQRIRDIARGLGTFSKVEKDQLVPVDLRHVIEVAVNMAYNEIKYRARLVKDYGKTPAVFASEGRLSQVFLNLIINASHAIDEGNVEDNEIRVRTWSETDTVFAEVRDTGSGIPPENLGKLFEPFFTTKKIGVGSGLGLAISKNIVEGYGGTIDVKSEVGKGTSFTISIPVRYEEPATAEAPIQKGVDEDTQRGRFLIVDDEEGIRLAMVRMLRGHETVQAASGAEARAVLEKDQAFDLILCDMMMSDISGIDLHRWLAAEHPFLARQFIFITGGAFTPSASEYLRKVDNIRLEKPFDVANLKKIVSEFVQSAKRSRKK